ncbi:MAG TPA: hypothetical protein VFT16_02200 [Candidatus Saccharimonadales bacterium]|nr:hypothetical protein [Candidatus Saccharimonadales bacterium]
MQESTNSRTSLSLDQRVSEASARLDLAQAAADQQRDTVFWRQCVRDTSGRWAAYTNQKSAYGVPYFRGGQKTYKTPEEHRYLLAHIDTRRAFYESLPDVPNMDTNGFKDWLEVLRALLEYRKSESPLHEKSVTDKHTKIILDQVLPLAKKYGDPYYDGRTNGPVFAGIPPRGLPRDEKQDDIIYHHYPLLAYTDIYLSQALHVLKNALEDNLTDMRAYICKVARFFQLLINLHLFAAVNVSLYMNMADGLLEIAGLEGIEHGIVDFVAFRLQPESFERYFYDTVMAGQQA